MNKTHKDILKVLSIDPLSEAEKITGVEYKDDKNTIGLGLALQVEKSKVLDRLLDYIDDTKLCNKLSDYLSIVQRFGFKIVYTEDFKADQDRAEKMYILWHDDLSILLRFDTFTCSHESEPNVNSGNIYYNWAPHNRTYAHGLTSSGGFFNEKDNKPHLTLFEKDFSAPYYIPNYPTSILWEPGISYEEFKIQSAPVDEQQSKLFDQAINEGKRLIWVGDHDCREAIITKIKALFENGAFVKEWKACAFPWLTHYADHKGDNRYPFTDHYEKTRAIISKLPPHVQKCIGTYKP